MAYDFSALKKHTTEISAWFSGELSAIHSGRASVALLESVRVPAYGNAMPINQVANLGVEDARTVRITPWDQTVSAAIEKAIQEANLGVSVSSDGKGIRVSFPEMTTESREKFVKVVGKKLEEGRISVRSSREETWADIQKKEKDGKISEDDKFRFKEEMEKIIKEANETLDALAQKKEREILG
jgi:ribosome recycling factor